MNHEISSSSYKSSLFRLEIFHSLYFKKYFQYNILSHYLLYIVKTIFVGESSEFTYDCSSETF